MGEGYWKRIAFMFILTGAILCVCIFAFVIANMQ